LARITNYVVSFLLMAITVGLLITDPAVKPFFNEKAEPTMMCDEDPLRTRCPNDCFGQGSCNLNHRCACNRGWAGDDCSAEYCPNECSGHGTCYDGICLCDPSYGGPDCTVDRIMHLSENILEDVHLDLDFQGTCEFLTKQDLERSGGERIMYWSEATSQMETYSVPEGMASVLPETCPQYKFETCAVVGNSGTLLFEEKGLEIDAHQMVYRFNQAPTEGFETHLGNHTMFESLNAKFANQLMRSDPAWRWRDPLAIYILFEPLKLQEVYATIRAKYSQIDILLFGPEFFVKAHQIYDQMQLNLEKNDFGCFTGEKPMSGFYAVLYALSSCKKVDLYGFDPWTDAMARDHSRQYRYHYFDDEQPRTGAHSFDAVYYMYRVMSLTKKTGLTVHSAKIPLPVDRLDGEQHHPLENEETQETYENEEQE